MRSFFMLDFFTEEMLTDSQKEAVVEEQQRRVDATVREREQAEAVQRERGEPVRTKDMNPTMMIPPTSYHYWGQRLGYDCWEDEQFVREFLRDNAVCRVKTRPANASVGWTAAIEYSNRKSKANNLVNGVWIK